MNLVMTKWLRLRSTLLKARLPAGHDKTLTVVWIRHDKGCSRQGYGRGWDKFVDYDLEHHTLVCPSIEPEVLSADSSCYDPKSGDPTSSQSLPHIATAQQEGHVWMPTLLGSLASSWNDFRKLTWKVGCIFSLLDRFIRSIQRRVDYDLGKAGE